MKIFVVLLAVSAAFAASVDNESTREKRQLLVLVPQPAVQEILYVPIVPAGPQQPLTCGIPSFTCEGACVSNSVGGIPAVKGEYPWLAQIYSGSRQICGGSLIDRDYILTAASCVEPATPSSVAALRVRVGDFKLNSQEDGIYVERNVSVVYRHADFGPQRLQPAVNDIALLKLSEPVVFTDYIKPICLDDGANRVDNGFNEGIVAGYGKLSYSSRPPTDALYKVNLRIGTPQECQNTYAPFGVALRDEQLCAGTNTLPPVDPCVGDNGGPLFVRSGPNHYKQVGIASFGLKCSGPPAVFTRVSKYRAWIDQVRFRQGLQGKPQVAPAPAAVTQVNAL